jgi:heat shock protein HslJ
MACPPAVMDQEQRFLSALGAVTTLRVDAGKLLPLDESGRVRVRLAPLDRAAATRLTSADVKGESSYSR